MRDVPDLIKKLRDRAKWYNDRLVAEAADALEELTDPKKSPEEKKPENKE